MLKPDVPHFQSGKLYSMDVFILAKNNTEFLDFLEGVSSNESLRITHIISSHQLYGKKTGTIIYTLPGHKEHVNYRHIHREILVRNLKMKEYKI